MLNHNKKDAITLLNDALASIGAVSFLCDKNDDELKADTLKAIDILQNMKRKINSKTKKP